MLRASLTTIVGRVETALGYLAPGRITLNPDCGFAPGSAATVSTDEVYQKLKNEVAAADTPAAPMPPANRAATSKPMGMRLAFMEPPGYLRLT